nr:penicillin-binding protein 1C [Legionella spiritensis]
MERVRDSMKLTFRLTRIIVVVLFVSALAFYFFIPKPPLLNGISYSTGVFDEQRRLLRLTLSHDDQYRLYTSLDNMALQLVEATLLQEDQYFYRHPGVNPVAMLKAAWQTFVLRSRRIGASTITMQVARMRFKIHSRTLTGKVAQILRALQLERHYSKKELLEAYLNLAPYGHNIEGIGAASLVYFNKPAEKLTLPEALALAVIPQNPGRRTPDNHQLQPIRDKLFQRWLRIHPDDENQQAAMNLPLAMRSMRQLPFKAPHFVNDVLNHHPDQKTILTTLDGRLQRLVERVSRRYLARTASLGANNAAIMLVDTRTMGVKALTGSASFFNAAIDGQINGTDIKRSPGSTLKPFIYALALDQGLIHPATVLKDVPHRFGSYNPENFDYDFMGPVKAKDALILSRNIPAVDLANQLTNPTLYEFLEDARVSSLKPASYYGLALSLGGAELSMKELTTLYATLVNDGVWHELRLTQDAKRDAGKRLLSPEASFLVLDMLKDTPGLQPVIQRHALPVAWKTGTSSGYRDAWSAGAFGPYVLAVWIGHFNNQGNPAFVGKNIAAPLFFEIVEAMNQELGPIPKLNKYPQTMNLTQVRVCKASGMLPTRFCQDTELTWFIPGKSPITTDTIYREVAIDSTTGLRTCHINEQSRFEIFEFWPSDLLATFRQAGIQRRSPPPYEPGCGRIAMTGLIPQITSPHHELQYIVRAHALQKTRIPLTAVADADVSHLYWFINGRYLAKTRRDQPYWWRAKPGHYIVRVVDEHGLANTREITVSVAD